MSTNHPTRQSKACRAAIRLGLIAGFGVLASTGCASKLLDSSSSSYVIVDALQAASGAAPTAFGGTLASDVITNVKSSTGATGATGTVPTVFEDLGQVTLSLALKDPGTAASPTSPTTTNFITITRYHVDFVRADGRNAPGVDVPFSFDGGLTVTVGSSPATVAFTLVRSQAKQEAPLQALVNGGGAITISTIATVTFYGADQTGRAVTAIAQISVTFSDWGDPS